MNCNCSNKQWNQKDRKTIFRVVLACKEKGIKCIPRLLLTMLPPWSHCYRLPITVTRHTYTMRVTMDKIVTEAEITLLQSSTRWAYSRPPDNTLASWLAGAAERARFQD